MIYNVCMMRWLATMADEIVKNHKATFIRSQLLANHGITAIFSLRHGGISPPPFQQQNFGAGLGDDERHIKQNMDNFIKAAALPGPPHQACQVHGVEILQCNGQGRMHHRQADILITTQRDVALAVRTADCLPILLADPIAGIIAAVHAGWRGSAKSIARRAIRAMEQRGADQRRLLAWLGPCIGPCCFAIGTDIAEALQQSIAGAAMRLSYTPSAMFADLQEINRLQLRDAGISSAHIEISRNCTACDAARFFSFRRDHGVTGRHLAVVAIPAST